jgi:ATP-dependent DNA helicase RecQ
MENAQLGKYKIIYVAPERLMTESFLALIDTVNISMLAVDEAHCISQWGQDFRPSYLKIVDFINRFPKRPVIAAYTATATKTVKEDIICILGLINPTVVVTGYDRKNLYFSVQKPQNKTKELLAFLRKNEGKSGIIYCNTRKTVEEVQEELFRNGYPATRYHAGLSDAERNENQEAFTYDRAPIMVATNAFGMGIDKSNIRFVIHYNMPKDIESYYQEVGRAGRDGEAAECILYYSGQDVRVNEFIINKQGENEELAYEERQIILERDRKRLRKMTFYCFTNECLRDYILRYFGELGSNYCGNCENCLTEFEDIDITTDAINVISLIKTSGERYGITAIVDAAHGNDNAKVRQFRLDQNALFGSLKSKTIPRIRQILNDLLVKSYLYLTTDEYPVLKITGQGMALIQDVNLLEPMILKLPKEREKVLSKESGKAQNRNNAANGRIMEVRYPELFEQLRRRRYEIAQAEHMPPYIIFSDRALREMSTYLPTTKQSMLAVNGVGTSKFEKHGQEFMQMILEFMIVHNIEPEAVPKNEPETIPKNDTEAKGDVTSIRNNVSTQGGFTTYKEDLLAKGKTKAYASWSEEEDQQLTREFLQGMNMRELSELHKRTNGAMKSRLKKLGLIKE